MQENKSKPERKPALSRPLPRAQFGGANKESKPVSNPTSSNRKYFSHQAQATSPSNSPKVMRTKDLSGKQRDLKADALEFVSNVKDKVHTKWQNIRSKGPSNNQKYERGVRVYTLRGYTTVAQIDRKYRDERQQRNLRKLLTIMIAAMVILMLLIVYNPLRDMQEIRRAVGYERFFNKENLEQMMQTTVVTTVDTTTTAP